LLPRRSLLQTQPCYLAFAPSPQALSFCHPGSFWALKCLPRLRKNSPPACSSSGWTRSLLRGLPGIATRRMISKFLRESSSFQLAPPVGIGCRRRGVPFEWHDTHRAWPGRFARKIGCILFLNTSKSSVVDVPDDGAVC